MKKNTVYGYCRVSTNKQNLERQIKEIAAHYPDAVIVSDKYTGTRMERPEWDKLCRKLKSGDTVVFESVSRMSRNAAEGAAVYEELYNRGINLVFLSQPFVNTDNYRQAASASIDMTGNEIADIYIEATNRVLMLLARKQVQQAFQSAEDEVTEKRRATAQGVRNAQDNGKQVGRAAGASVTTKKSIAAKEEIKKYSKRYGGSLNDTDTMKMVGLARNTFYKYIKEMAAE